MKIAVIGSGALGLYYGAMLQRGGQDVHFLLRRDYQAICEHGLKVLSINGDFVLPKVQGYQRPEEIGPADLVLIGLKTFANQQLKALISPLVGDSTRILTLQNGLGNEQLLAGLFGAERIIGGIAFLASNRGEPGVVHHLAFGHIIIGNLLRDSGSDLETLAEVFNSCGIGCRVSGDLMKTRWEKLVWNIPFNGLCALLLQTVDRLLANPQTSELIREIMLEVIRAANAQGLTESIPFEYAAEMMRLGGNAGAYKPSMMVDREEGRQLEVSSIMRVPLEYGCRAGVAMPRTAMLATLLEQALTIESAREGR